MAGENMELSFLSPQYDVSSLVIRFTYLSSSILTAFLRIINAVDKWIVDWISFPFITGNTLDWMLNYTYVSWSTSKFPSSESSITLHKFIQSSAEHIFPLDCPLYDPFYQFYYLNHVESILVQFDYPRAIKVRKRQQFPKVHIDDGKTIHTLAPFD